MEIITAEFPIYQHKKPMLSLNIVYGGRLIAQHPSHLREGNFFSLELLSLPVVIMLESNISISDCIIHCHGVPYITSNKGTHFTANEIQSWTCSWNSLVLPQT